MNLPYVSRANILRVLLRLTSRVLWRSTTKDQVSTLSLKPTLRHWSRRLLLISNVRPRESGALYMAYQSLSRIILPLFMKRVCNVVSLDTGWLFSFRNEYYRWFDPLGQLSRPALTLFCRQLCVARISGSPGRRCLCQAPCIWSGEITLATSPIVELLNVRLRLSSENPRSLNGRISGEGYLMVSLAVVAKQLILISPKAIPLGRAPGVVSRLPLDLQLVKCCASVFAASFNKCFF